VGEGVGETCCGTVTQNIRQGIEHAQGLIHASSGVPPLQRNATTKPGKKGFCQGGKKKKEMCRKGEVHTIKNGQRKNQKKGQEEGICALVLKAMSRP